MNLCGWRVARVIDNPDDIANDVANIANNILKTAATRLDLSNPNRAAATQVTDVMN
jgi:hypothetical protein